MTIFLDGPAPIYHKFHIFWFRMSMNLYLCYNVSMNQPTQS